MSVAISLVVQDTWPPRVALGVSGLTPGDLVTVYRLVGGTRTTLRGTVDTSGNPVQVAGTTLAVTDAEMPFGVPVAWVVEVDGADAVTSSTATYTLDGGLVALSDAITGLAAEVYIGTWPARRRERRASTFALTDLTGSGYTVVVAGAAGQSTSQVQVETLTDTASAALEKLLEQCTGAVVQLRVPDASVYTRQDSYLAVLAWEETRWSQDGNDPKRHWVLDCTEVRGWATALEALAWTYDDWSTAYSGQSYNTVKTSYVTYLDAQLADIGGLL